MPERARRSLKAGLARAIGAVLPDLLLTEEGPDQVDKLGHRRYIGGDWDEAGAALFAFLRARGLERDSVLLDIACGSFRLGTKAIPFLDPGCYLGLEKEAALIAAGIEHELGAPLVAEKRPELVISSDFAFANFTRRPDIAIASSLFTHLTPAAIDLCLGRLRPALQPGAPFYATFRIASRWWRNPSRSNAFASFRYTPDQMAEFGRRNGFVSDYIGEWRPGGQQVMMCYRADGA